MYLCNYTVFALKNPKKVQVRDFFVLFVSKPNSFLKLKNVDFSPGANNGAIALFFPFLEC